MGVKLHWSPIDAVMALIVGSIGIFLLSCTPWSTSSRLWPRRTICRCA